REYFLTRTLSAKTSERKMKLIVLRFLVVALSCASAVLVIANLRTPKVAANERDFSPLFSTLGMPQPAQTPAAEQTVAQEGREKNIKLLGDLPASQLIPVMYYFAVSMGRRCNFCHVNNQGQWDYASDAKLEKNTAREMIRMVLDTNKNFFKGNLEVQCYTCHRGRNNPQSVVTLPLPVPSPPPGGGQGRPAGPLVLAEQELPARSHKARQLRDQLRHRLKNSSASTSPRLAARQTSTKLSREP